jgi:hypothetical protein
MTIDWKREAADAADRVALSIAGARDEEGLQASAESRANGTAAQNTRGESEYWLLRAQLHAIRRTRLSEEARAEKAIEAHARRHASP